MIDPLQIAVGVLGLFIGSFLGVVIDRLPKGESIAHGRSHCDHCKKQLQWWELIPVFSYFALQGRCSKCHQKLSIKYPAIELFTAFSFFFYAYAQGLSLMNISEISSWQVLDFLSGLIFIAALISHSVIDFKKGILPDEINVFLIYIFIGKTLVLTIIAGFITNAPLLALIWHSAIEMLLEMSDAALAGLFFYMLVLITKGRGMGGGDVKLAFVMGLFMTSGQTLLAVYSSFLLGGVIAGSLLLFGRKKFGQTIPFGPFMALGSYLALIYYEEIYVWYIQRVIGQ